MKHVLVMTSQICDFQNPPKTLKPYFCKYNCTRVWYNLKFVLQNYTEICSKHTKYTKGQK